MHFHLYLSILSSADLYFVEFLFIHRCLKHNAFHVQLNFCDFPFIIVAYVSYRSMLCFQLTVLMVVRPNFIGNCFLGQIALPTANFLND